MGTSGRISYFDAAGRAAVAARGLYIEVSLLARATYATAV